MRHLEDVDIAELKELVTVATEDPSDIEVPESELQLEKEKVAEPEPQNTEEKYGEVVLESILKQLQGLLLRDCMLQNMLQTEVQRKLEVVQWHSKAVHRKSGEQSKGQEGRREELLVQGFPSQSGCKPDLPKNSHSDLSLEQE